MVFKLKFLYQTKKKNPVFFAGMTEHIWVSLSQNDINKIRVLFYHFRQSFNNCFNALASPDKTKSKQHFFIFEFKFLFRFFGIKVNIRNAMFYQCNFFFWYIVNAYHKINRFVAHHHNFMGHFTNFL